MGDESADKGGRPESPSGLIEQICSRFETAWRTGPKPRIEEFLPAESPQLSAATRLNILLHLVGIDLKWRWKSAEAADQQEAAAAERPRQSPKFEVSESTVLLPRRPRLVDYVVRYPLLGPIEQLPKDLIVAEYAARRRYGGQPTHAEYLDVFRALHPDLAKELQAIDDNMAAAPEAARGQPNEHGLARTAPFVAAPSPKLPPQIGRYRVEKLLGRGGYGLVYLARDDKLDRKVEIKVPHARLVTRPEDAEPYLIEARTVAGLDHTNIVPVYDVGSTDKFPVFVVSKYIDGTSLAAKIKESRLGIAGSVELVLTVAEALHYAHKQDLVHRDIKPGNILLECSGKPYVADFGLALRESDSGRGPRFVGTPAYMRPEQARGEAHRVDGRSDIFSLGIVLYELLAGRRPFRAETETDLLDQITSREPKPLRQIDDTIPKELDRICQRALAKRATERYLAAKDLADDLRHFLADGLHDIPSTAPPAQKVLTADTKLGSDTPPATPTPESQPIKIVPKGLRSFDAGDADFFLELLPGPRDREGLPDSIRFWKTRIEEMDPDRTFSVGLIYGPSGCGKSSLVKAGLLPRLSQLMIPVYVEATAAETESRLLHSLRKHCPGLADSLGLRETLAALRRGEDIPSGKKVLIVLDQFEQWLHVQKGEEATELVQALRQCDGGHVQCIVMVRDDFWMAATRFMRSLEIRLVEGENSNAVDLFQLRHAEKVLAAFGRAFGDLREGPAKATKEQESFLTRAVQDLAEDGKVICVRLALFAEMLKGKSWTPATLKEVGGTAGVGVTFLEETFSASTAPPEHRYHQKSARAVLKALLPDSGTDIKGHMRSYAELLAASGYLNRPKDFHDLIGILDGEIRLITPTDPEGKEGGEENCGAGVPPAAETAGGTPGNSPLLYSGEGQGVRAYAPKATTGTCAGPNEIAGGTPAPQGHRFYQLTHDYLVPSLRDWLTRKQKETRRGRAELLLADRASVWNARPENRQLPSVLQWATIRLFTRKKNWSDPQRKMMRAAARHHGLCWGTGLALVVTLGIILQQYLAANRLQNDTRRAESLVDAVLAAPPVEVPHLIEKLEPLREHALRVLNHRFAEDSSLSASQRLHAAFAMAALGRVERDFLVESTTSARPDECRNLISALRPEHEAAVQGLRQQAEKAGKNKDWPAKARLAIVALHLGESALARDMLQVDQRPDLVERTVFIKTFATWHGYLSELLPTFGSADDSAIRSGIVCALGGVSPDALSPAEKNVCEPTISNWYRSQSDAGTHAAAAFALGQWKLAIPPIAPGSQAESGAGWRVNSIGMTLVLVPSGQFLMGSVDARDEKQHRVRITKPFWLGMNLVTVGHYRKFAESKKDANMDWKTAFPEQADDQPVVVVSWDDAQAFCAWLNEKEGTTGMRYGLPTEAEWEYACRAGTRTQYSFGDDERDLVDYGWFTVNAYGRTHPVGQKLPNTWGLFDMHGNAWEWCQDWYDAGYYATSPTDNPPGPTKGSFRVLRGGSWFSDAERCRSASRCNPLPVFRRIDLGFRVALVPADKQGGITSGAGAQPGPVP